MRTVAMSAASAVLVVVVATGAPAGENGGAVPKVREERPRLVLRAKAWDGPSVERIGGWMARPEYKDNFGRLGGDGVTGALRYLVLGDEAAGKKCVAWLKGLKPPAGQPKDSPSYTGETLMNHAMIYDWLRNHPDFVREEDRRGAVAYLEWWGDLFRRHNSPGVVPFYCRNTGACMGLTAVAIALHGDSPRAAEFLAHAFRDFRENIGTIREAEDGATGGATYGYVHQFGATAQTAAAWRSGTDWDAARWIKEKQGNWLERQMLWQMWATYPNGWLWKEGDLWSGSHRDRNNHGLSIAAVSDMYRNGHGRAHHDAMVRRWGLSGVYYQWRMLWFFLYNNPDLPSLPLDGLGRADVFSPGLHAYVCWRDSWNPDATVVHFKAGDNVDHHGTQDTGKFTIFKSAPLAIKNGYYGKYKSAEHMYYKSPWSANVVVFEGPRSHGWQRGVSSGAVHGCASWKTWKAKRDTLHPVSGVLLGHEATGAYARALADLSGSTHPDDSGWTRELVFLGYRYLLVLDRVRPGAGVKTRWIMHSVQEPKIDPERRLVMIDNGAARLFCRTLLPEDAAIVKVGGGGRAHSHRNQRGEDVEWEYNARSPELMLGQGRFDVIPAKPGEECVYLHVLFPTDAGTAAMPACSVKKDGESYTVKVAELEYTFRPIAGK